MANGTFITFEGGEGAGKSTQVRALAERLRAAGRDVVVTREPGGTPFAEQVRELILRPDVAEHAPLSEALLFYAARADHIEKVIRPALAVGRFVLCDRFSDSTRVYQSVAGGLPGYIFDALEEIVVAGTRPDLTFVLDLDARVGLQRAEARRSAVDVGASSAEGVRDKFERQGLVYHEKLRAGFLAIAAQEPDRCRVIDAGRAADAVASDVWAELSRRLLAHAG